LGHKKLDTTALYTRVAISAIGQVTSPLDFLQNRTRRLVCGIIPRFQMLFI
jgi:hypothetical protein